MTRTVPPGWGSKLTKRSNTRGKRRRKLSKLKSVGVLPENANFEDLARWEEQNPGNLDALISSKIIAHQDAVTGAEEKEDSTAGQKQSDDANTPTNSISVDTFAVEPTVEEPVDESYIVIPRSKSSDFTPKDTPTEPTNGQNAANGEQKTLLVGATECLYEDVELDSPPYPFVQRWDEEAIAIIRNKVRSSQSKKQKTRSTSRKGQSNGETEADVNTDYGTETAGNAVTNDATPEGHDAVLASGQTEHNAAEDQITGQTQDTDFASQENRHVAPNGDTDDLPPLPDNVSSLKPATKDEVTQNTVIAFKQLELTAQWQPEISPWRTAIITEVLDDGRLSCRLAKRDRKQPSEPEKDEEGNHVYSKFDMPGYSDKGEEDDGIREVAYSGLIEPKILVAAPAPASLPAPTAKALTVESTAADPSSGGTKRKISQLEAKLVRPRPRRNANKGRS